MEMRGSSKSLQRRMTTTMTLPTTLTCFHTKVPQQQQQQQYHHPNTRGGGGGGGAQWGPPLESFLQQALNVLLLVQPMVVQQSNQQQQLIQREEELPANVDSSANEMEEWTSKLFTTALLYMDPAMSVETP